MPVFARFLITLLAVLPVAPAHAANDTGDTLEVLRITPAGEDVAAGRQLVVQFDRAVVALGDMSRAATRIRVRIQPRVTCQWRWLDPRNLACELGPGEQLRPATRYAVHIDPGLTALDGSRMQREHVHRFITERPRVTRVRFSRWLSADRPVLQAWFNQPVGRASVQKHLFFRADEEGSARIALRAAAPHADGEAVLEGDATPAQLANAALLASQPRRVWLLTPGESLPQDAQVGLEVEPGLRGDGPEPGIETRSAIAFDTFPEFRFTGVRCTHVQRREPVILPLPADPRDGPTEPGPCDPLAGVALLFSTPVDSLDVGKALALTPPLSADSDPLARWRDSHQRAWLRNPHTRGAHYPVWLPPGLKAFQGYRLALASAALRDAFGRPLDGDASMRFGTSHRQPRLHVPHTAAVLEADVDSEVPVYVTNLEAVDLEWRGTGALASGERRQPVPAVDDLSFAVPLGVREMLGGESGAVSGTLHPVPAAAEHDDRRFFAQVTPFNVTVKLGHFSSIAWVTRMDDGSPVAGATLTLYPDTYTGFSGPGDGARGPFTTDAEGIARLPGSAVLDPQLQLLEGWREGTPRLFLRVSHDDDLAVLPLDGAFRIWTREIWPRRRPEFGHLRAWGTTAQGLYRAGDTMDYKLYVRHQDTRALLPAPVAGYRLSVIDPKGEALVKRQPFTLNPFGAADGQVTIPADAPVGWYRFQVETEHGKQTLQAFRVLVSDFTPAPFAVATTLNATRAGPGDRLAVTTAATLHAGGPYTGAEARVTVRVAPRPLDPEHPLARRFHFDTGDAGGWRTLHQDQAPLGPDGERQMEVTLTDVGVAYGRLQAESAVRDDRGKRVANSASAVFAARDRFVGLRSTRWMFNAGDTAAVDYLVVTPEGAPVAGVPVALAVEREEVYAARVKGAGNAYRLRYERRWVPAADCSGRSTDQGATCLFVPAAAGRYRVTARIADSRGRVHQSALYTWVGGSGRVTWAEPEGGALALVAESVRPRVGDTARYLVRNPFPGATALITVERYGVLRAWTQRLEGSTPVIAFEIEPDDVPGFHLSVTVMSPRVSAPPPQRGQVDLGKPALRMGYVTVPVDDPVKRLDVTVSADAKNYEPGDTAAVTLQVATRDGLPPTAGAVELAVAVLDEAVFDLIKGARRNFDPYTGFYRLEPPDVVGYSLLTRLVGRQKFEKKGANAGGDGGAATDLRDVDRFLAYWNPSLTPDSSGRARIRFPVPGNLTRWRVLALAVTPTDRMGLGDGGFVVTKDTELRPVMPNHARPGDRFRAGFTVLNRHDRTRTLEVELALDGSAAEAPLTTHRVITVPPFTRAPVWLDVVAARPGTLRISARAGDEHDRDALVHELSVRQYATLQIAAAHDSLEQGSQDTALVIPENLLDGSGTISVTASPSVIGNADGAFRYMRDYPYACWEQRLSKAVMAANYSALRGHLDPALAWPGSDTLPAQTLEQADRFQAPNGGMSYWVADDARTSPYLSAYTALAFSWLESVGVSPPQRVSTRLDDYLERLLRRDVMPDFYTRGMASSVRAVALAALARRGRLGAGDALRHEPALPHMSVFAKAHYLEALYRTLGPSPAVDAARDALLGHADESAGGLTFSEGAIDTSHRHLLETPARANCAALGALSLLAADAQMSASIGPLLPKLARTVSAARGRRDHWENTQENVFCMSALAQYARTFEAGPPSLTLRADLDGERLGEARFTSRRDRPVVLERALRAADAGSEPVLHVQHAGSGRAYYAARLRYATRDALHERINAGMALRREYSVERDGRWQVLEAPLRLRRGELVRVDLYLSLPAPRHFVVVDDPVSGALEPVNREFATTSTLDAQAGDFQAGDGAWWHSRDDWHGFGSGRWSFYHRELRHDTARFFSDYLPAGNYHLSYSAQVIASGAFHIPPARAEEMYDPERFATGLPAALTVAESPAR